MKPHIAGKLEKSDVKDIKLSVIFKNLGQGLYSTFEPIIFYGIFNQHFELVLLYYGIQSLLYALVVHAGAKVMSKIGIKKNLILGTVFLIIYSLVLLKFASSEITLESNPYQTIGMFSLLAVICAIYQSLYWPAFHTDLSLFMRRRESGKNIGTFYLIGQLSSIIGPVFGALILTQTSIRVLIILKVILLIISTIPLSFGPDDKPIVSMNLKGFISELTKKRGFKFYLPFHAEGVNGYIGAVFWGLFVYTILDNILDLGLIASGVSLVTGIIVFILGFLIDKKKHLKDTILRVGVATSSIGWLIKGFPSTGFFFFIADNIQKFGDRIARIPFEKTMYNRFKNTKSLADEYVVLREMAYHIGGGLIMIFLAFIIWQFNLLQAAFVVAAISTLVYLFMK